MYSPTGKVDDKQALLLKHADLVKRMAHQIKAKLPASVEVDDLIQAGMIGLLDAINRFQDDQGAQFVTYATQRIHGAIIDELRHSDWMPRSVRKKMRDVEKAIHVLEQRLGRPPTESEVAKHLKLTITQYYEMLSDCGGHNLIYFEDFHDEDGDDHFLDRHVHDQKNDVVRLLISGGFRDALTAAIENLPEREKLLMSLYYEQDLNLKEIGAVMTITESRVSQLHSQAVARLRAALKEQLWTGPV
jgi:RNA polymerase sigma factor for flagellar operon FliA